jgi:serine/threonine protein kinase
MIRAFKHPNIVPSIAIIRRGEKRYFVSQWADGGSLQDLWKSMPRPNLNAHLVREVLQQLRGLASALGELQKIRDDKSPYLRSGYLKPESILRFRNGPSTVVGTLKIAVMGIEQQPTIASYRGILTPPPTTALYGTTSYEPPEVFTQELAAEGMSSLGDLPIPHIPRLHDFTSFYDVWSIGCVILEFLVWILYGYDELTRFHEKIKGPMGGARQFFVIEQENGNQVAKLCSIVTDYMDHISKDPECAEGTGLGDLLRLTRKYFLVVSLPSRSTAERCCYMLDQILEMGGKNERYWFTGTKRDGLRGPSSVYLLRNSSFLSPESAQQRRPSTDAGRSIPSMAIVTKAPTSAVFDLAP